MKMKKLVLISVLSLACVSLLLMSRAYSAANDDAEIRQLLDRWKKAFEAKDLNGIMSIYEPGQALVAYDIVPPLQYKGFDAYKKDYQEFLGQFDGPIGMEIRDLNIVAGDRVAFARGLERLSGTLKGGHKLDMWVRFTECYRKTNGHWLAIHDHVSVPADFDSGKAVMDLKP
jgi:ketosteroid isomerase-like protein